MNTKQYKLIDLFCGAGGMSLGFTDDRFGGGFKSIFAIDNDIAAVNTYNSNFGHDDHCIIDDIENAVKGDIPQSDIVIGGPPCQGFSLLNKNRMNDSRRELWEPYLEIVKKSNASIFVMENVPGLIKSAEIEKILFHSKKMDFEVLSPVVLNTADYGVPQTRKRAIIIGYKISEFENCKLPTFPPLPTHASPKQTINLPRWKTVKDSIHDLPLKPNGVNIKEGSSPPLNLHFGRNPTSMSIERYDAVPPGGNRFDLQKNRPDITPNCWLNKPSGGTDLFGRLWWDRPSVTIRTEFFKPEKGRYLHPTENRPITHREAARLMSFPDDFHFTGTKIEIARQIGNAVPPTFAGQIAKTVKLMLETRTKESSSQRAA